MWSPHLLLAAHQINQMKGSIYMVFDYMDHDLTGLLERKNYKLSLPQVKILSYRCAALSQDADLQMTIFMLRKCSYQQ